MSLEACGQVNTGGYWETQDVQKDCAFMKFVCLWSKTQQHAAPESFTISEKQEASSSYMMQCTAESHMSCIQ